MLVAKPQNFSRVVGLKHNPAGQFVGTASHTPHHGNKQQAHTEGIAARGMHAAGKQHVVSTSLQQMMRKEAPNTNT
jgi:hypothetical protein